MILRLVSSAIASPAVVVVVWVALVVWRLAIWPVVVVRSESKELLLRVLFVLLGYLARRVPQRGFKSLRDRFAVGFAVGSIYTSPLLVDLCCPFRRYAIWSAFHSPAVQGLLHVVLRWRLPEFLRGHEAALYQALANLLDQRPLLDGASGLVFVDQEAFVRPYQDYWRVALIKVVCLQDLLGISQDQLYPQFRIRKNGQ